METPGTHTQNGLYTCTLGSCPTQPQYDLLVTEDLRDIGATASVVSASVPKQQTFALT